MYQDEGACGFPPEKNDLNLRFVDAIFEWMARETCIDTSKAQVSSQAVHLIHRN